ncbi:MAG: DUF4245 domain-containing protein [Micrococcus sp.]|nr:DUF4245 domain-containing protein [Micrococcus sp.]
MSTSIPPTPDAATETPEAAPRPVLTAKQAQRASSSSIAMVLAVLATLGIAVGMMMFAPPPATPPREDRVNVTQEAAIVADIEELDTLTPTVPESWYANYARWSVSDGVGAWDIGWVVSDDVFAGLTQTDEANPTWLSQKVGPVGTGEAKEIDGLTWQPHRQGAGPLHYVGEVHGSTVILTTTGAESVLDDLARAVAAES